MNLHYDTTRSDLLKLIDTADPNTLSHNVAIDYDGEVIIDPELHFPHVDVTRYRFCTHVRDASLRKDYMIVALHKALLSTVKEPDLFIGAGEEEMSIAA